jgi:hypothetical protein
MIGTQDTCIKNVGRNSSMMFSCLCACVFLTFYWMNIIRYISKPGLAFPSLDIVVGIDRGEREKAHCDT